MPNLVGDKHLSIQLFLHKTRLFHLSTEIDGPKPSEMDIKVLIPAPTSRKQLISLIGK